MRILITILFGLFFQRLLAQQQSLMILEISYTVGLPDHATGSGQVALKVNIAPDEKAKSSIEQDSFQCCIASKKKVKSCSHTLRNVVSFDGKIADEKLVGILNFASIHFNKKPNKTRRSNHQFFQNIELSLQKNNLQNIDYQKDSIEYHFKIKLKKINCIIEKPTENTAAIVTVYYRKANEHLSKTAANANKGQMDFGHAFIGVKDLKTGNISFLDGWPNGDVKSGLRFAWNNNVNEARTADHHSISFNIDAVQMNAALQKIDDYRKAIVSYQMLDFNCTDASTKVLDAIGCYKNADNNATVLPETFAKQLMKKLRTENVCYELDGFKIL